MFFSVSVNDYHSVCIFVETFDQNYNYVNDQQKGRRPYEYYYMNFFNDLRRVEQRIPVVSTFLQNHDFLVLGTTKHMYEFVDRGTTDVLFNYCCNKHNEKFDVDDITRHELGMYV